ncbi:hypothetical protein [Streptomyces sp. CB01881]|uniref:hypothetical protein n=1 Tax=Streptomyces sp. CB01881 TaxID=2078691 RepID=UPI00129C3994|nr:hypothetical protein [Streptomyces sp. CB01881]
MLTRVVRVVVGGVVAALVLAVAGAPAHAGSAPRVAVEAANLAVPEGCSGSPSGCT